MKLNNLEGRGRGSSFRRRALTLVGASALTLSGVGAAVFGASQAFATQSNIQSNPYTIGTVVSGGLTFSATNTAQNATGVNYTFGFTVPTGDAGSNVTLANLPGSTSASTAVVTITSASGSSTTSTDGYSNGVVTTNTLSVGDTLSIVIDGFTNGSMSTNPYTISAAVANTTVANATFNLTAGASGPSVAVSPPTPSYQGSSTTFSGFTGISGNVINVEVSGGVTFRTGATPQTLAGNYTVTYTTSGSTTQNTATVQTASAGTAIGTTNPSGNWTQLSLGHILATGDTVSVVADGTDNSSSTGSSFGDVVAGTAVNGVPTPPNTAPTNSSPSFQIGNSMGAVSLTVSPTTVGASGATYGLSFTVPTTANGTQDLTYSFADNNGAPLTVASGSGYAVFDTTHPSVNFSGASNTSGFQLTGVSPGDVITVDIYGVTNSSNASATATVSLSGFTVPVKSNSVAYSAASASSSAVNVSVSNAAPSGTATYTISGLEVGGSGVTSAGATLQIDFSTGTSTTAGQTNIGLPTNGVNYTLTDLTNSSSSGLAGSPTLSGATNNQVNNQVQMTTANAITAGDKLEITITGVVNPSVAATNEYATADGAGSSLPLTTGVVTPTVTTAPNAASTMASGSLVQTGGTIYVIAGGVAYGIPTFSDYQTISNGLGNPSVVQDSTAPSTTGTVASGTLVQVVGSPEIMVVGSGNTAYGFSTPSEFLSDGYSFAKVIQIPSIGSLTAGSGTAPNAASTMASGSLVQTGGTIYVIAGGVAYGIPTFSDYQTISNGLGNPSVVQDSTAPSTTGTVASGTLVQVVGSPQVNVVTSTGTQVGFSTAAQFLSDGYSWSNVIMIP